MQRPRWCPFQGHQHAWRQKRESHLTFDIFISPYIKLQHKSSAMHYFCSSWFCFATNHAKSSFRVFSTALNILMSINLSISVTSMQESYNGQLSKKNQTSRLSNKMLSFQAKLSRNTCTREFQNKNLRELCNITILNLRSVVTPRANQE